MQTSQVTTKHMKTATRLAVSCMLFAFTIVFSLKSNAQAVCTALIDGSTNEFCVTSGSITFSNAIAVGQNVEWLSSGDGTFNNRFSQNPTYTPGPTDISRGFAYVYLDVYKDDPVDFCSELPVVTLRVGALSATATPASQSRCTGTSITTIQLSSSTSGLTYNWTRDNSASVTGIASSGTGNISGTLTNNTSEPVTVTFTITPTSASCTGSPITATVVVSPRPNAIASVTTQSVCSGSRITPITLSGTYPGTIYNWTRNATTTVTGIASSGTGDINGTVTKTSLTSNTTVTFTITPNLSGCAGTAVTSAVTVTTTSVSVSGTPASQSVCSGANIAAISITNGSNWTRSNTTNVTGIAASGSGAISGALTNGTTSPQYVTFTLSPTSGTCSNRAVVIVNPAPTATASLPSQNICSGAAITTIGLTSNISGTTFSWSRNNTASVTGIAASGTGDISGSLTNITNAPVTVSFTITPTANGCSGTPITASVTVNPRPTAVITGSQAICAGGALPSLNIALTGTGPWNITYTDGTTPVNVPGINTNSYNFTVPASVKTYTVTALSDALCTAQAANITGSAVLTQAAYAIVASSGANGTITPNGSTSVNCGNSQTYTITPNACYQIANVLVDGVSVGAVSSYTFSNVTAPHTISASFTQLSYGITASAGANGTITPSGLSNVNCGSNQTYTIAPNSGFNIQNVVVDGASVGAVSSYTFNNVTIGHTISATFAAAQGGCTPPALSTTATNILCANSSTGAVNLTTTGGSSPFTYAWTGPNGFTATTEDLTDVAAGTYNVVVTATGGCSASTSATITEPAALTITTAATAPACNATTTTLFVTATGGTGTRQYSLNGGAYQSIAQFTVTTSTTPYVVTVRDANGCTLNSTPLLVLQATTPPAAATGVDGPVFGLCGGGTYTYTAQPVAGAHNYSWSVPAGWTIVSGQNNAQIVVSVPPTFTTGTGGIWCTPKNGCGSGTAFRLTVNAALSYTAANLTGPSTATSGQSGVQYTLTQTAATNYNWTVPAGATITAGQGTNTITVTFGSTSGNVSVVASNTCGAGAAVTKAVTVSGGTGSSVITASAGANGTITPSGSVSVTNGTNQTFNIAANACYQIANVLVDGVSVGAVPTYTFTNVTVPHTISASFTQLSYAIAASAGANGTITPNGSTSVNCGNSQTYTITPNACYQIANVLVDGVSVGAVSSYTFSNVIAPHTISASFTQLSYGITASAGANGSITPSGLSNVNCGSNQVYAIAANANFLIQDVLVDGVSVGAVSTYTFSNVTAPHTISASFVGSQGCTAPALSTSVTNILCANSSTGSVNLTTTGGSSPFTYAWTGPNGFTATTEDLSNVAAGTYNVVVTATGGCSASTSATITQPAALTITTAATAPACNATTTTLFVTATGGTGTRQYSLNGGPYQSIAQFTVTTSTTPYVVTVRDANGCTLNSTPLLVLQASTPPAAATGVDGPVFGLCGGGTYTYTAQPVAGAHNYTWSVPAGWTIVSGQNNAQIVVSVPPTFTTGTGGIWCTPKNGCGSGTAFRLTVNAALSYTAANLTGPSTATSGQSGVQYTLTQTAATNYNWTVPAGATITAGQGTSTITVTFGSTSGNVSVVASNTCGTGAAVNKAVTVATPRPAGTQVAKTKATTPAAIEAKTTTLTIYPNPAYSNATVVFNSLQAGSKYELVVYNSLGNIMLAQSGTASSGANMVKMDLNRLTDGMYIVRLKTEGATVVQKLLKSK